jgi:hypothetical protein
LTHPLIQSTKLCFLRIKLIVGKLRAWSNLRHRRLSNLKEVDLKESFDTY